MKDYELDDLFKAFDEKIARPAELQPLVVLPKRKSLLVMTDLRRQSLTELIVGGSALLFLSWFAYKNRMSRSLLISASILLLFTAVGFWGAIRQMIFISKFEFAESVTECQTILASMQTHLISYLRLAVLQFPFFLAYVLIGFKILFDEDIWETGNKNWLISNLVLSVIFVPFSLRLYRRIHVKNLHIGWVKRLIDGFGGKKISEAVEFMNKVEEFKDE